MQNAEEFVKASIYPIIAARDAEWQARVEEMKKAAEAFQSLSVCYRIGKRPTEKLFDQLEKARAALGRIA